MSMSDSTIEKMEGLSNDLEKYPTVKKVYVQDDVMDILIHENKLTNEYVEYIEKINPKYVAGIAYNRGTNLVLVNKDYSGKLINVSESLSDPVFVPFVWSLN